MPRHEELMREKGELLEHYEEKGFWKHKWVDFYNGDEFGRVSAELFCYALLHNIVQPLDVCRESLASKKGVIFQYMKAEIEKSSLLNSSDEEKAYAKRLFDLLVGALDNSTINHDIIIASNNSKANHDSVVARDNSKINRASVVAVFWQSSLLRGGKECNINRGTLLQVQMFVIEYSKRNNIILPAAIQNILKNAEIEREHVKKHGAVSSFMNSLFSYNNSQVEPDDNEEEVVVAGNKGTGMGKKDIQLKRITPAKISM